MKAVSANLFRYLSVAAILIARSALAGAGTEGHGGGAVVCFDDPKIAAWIKSGDNPLKGQVTDDQIPHLTRVEALDLFEANSQQNPDGTPVDLVKAKPGETPDELAERISHRYLSAIPRIYDIVYRSRLAFRGRITYQDVGVGPLLDAKPIEVVDTKPDCALVAMAKQYDIGTAHYLQIDSRLFNWKRHTVTSQAVLLLHEYVYLEARDRGATDSLSTRAFTEVLIRNRGLTQGFALDQMYDLGFGIPHRINDMMSPEYLLNRRTLSRMSIDLLRVSYEMRQIAAQVLADFDRQSRTLVDQVNNLIFKRESLYPFACGSLDQCTHSLSSLLARSDAKKYRKEFQKLSAEAENIRDARFQTLAKLLDSRLPEFEKTVSGIPGLSSQGIERVEFCLREMESWIRDRSFWSIGLFGGEPEWSSVIAYGTAHSEWLDEYLRRLKMLDFFLDHEYVPAIE